MLCSMHAYWKLKICRLMGGCGTVGAAVHESKDLAGLGMTEKQSEEVMHRAACHLIRHDIALLTD